MSNSRGSGRAMCPRRVALPCHSRVAVLRVSASTAVEVATVKIGTRGSPLALAQAYMTRDLLKVSIHLRLCLGGILVSSVAML